MVTKDLSRMVNPQWKCAGLVIFLLLRSKRINLKTGYKIDYVPQSGGSQACTSYMKQLIEIIWVYTLVKSVISKSFIFSESRTEQ